MILNVNFYNAGQEIHPANKVHAKFLQWNFEEKNFNNCVRWDSDLAGPDSYRDAIIRKYIFAR